MLGRRSARVLRFAPQHICQPCLRRQLLQPPAVQSSSLTTSRPVLFHTTAALRDQPQSESSNQLADAAPSSLLQRPDDDGGKADDQGPGTENRPTKTPKRRSRQRAKKALKRTAKKESASDDLQQSDQDDEKTFAPGQLENHSTLLEALKSSGGGNESPVRRVQTKTVQKSDDQNGKKDGRMRKVPGSTAERGDAARPSSKDAKAKKGKEQAKTAKKSSVDEDHEADSISVHHKGSLSAQELHLTPIDVEQPPVPAVSYGLDRVLFNPGVYHLQDPRTQVFNFDPYLSNVMPVSEFNFNSLGEYITSSRDSALSELAQEHQKTFVGSTSSMTSSLAHFHYLLSCWRPIDISMLSKAFPERLTTFTRLNRLPASVFLRYKDGVYSIDADKEYDSSNILAMLGKSLEKLLTLPTEEYERYRVSNPNQISKEERNQPESYHYTSMGDILMRSQLDAQDSRLPGTGMFDLKTRAVVSIRMDVQCWDQNTGYQIKGDLGQFESYEREYYDMMRSMMLKYSLQARMGRMDGIFVAYHNIERIFGFQYISLEEMDRGIHGTKEGRHLGDQEFRLSIGLLNKVLREAIQKFPETSLRVHFETRESQASPWMYIFAEPMTEDQIQVIQDSNKAQVQAFERRVLGLETEESGDSEDTEEAGERDIAASDTTIEEGVNATPVVESDMHQGGNSDEGVEAISEEVEERTTSEEVQAAEPETATTEPADEDMTAPGLLEQMIQDIEDLHWGTSVDKITLPDLDADGEGVNENFSQEDSVDASSKLSEDHSGRPILALKLFVSNRVDGELVQRPDRLDAQSNWSVDYSLQEIDSPDKAVALYKACRKRRADGFDMSARELSGDKVLTYYQKLLRRLSAKGREWRADRDEELERRGKVVLQSHGASGEPRRLDELDRYLSWLYNRGSKGQDD